MKSYRGMYKQYFELKSKQKVLELAQLLREGVSAINPDFSIGDAPAFIVYCDEMLLELSAIRNINREIHLLSRHLPALAMKQFESFALVEEIHQTNELENIHSTRKEIRDEMLVIENGKKGKRFDGMIRKYCLLLTNEAMPLTSCQDVRSLYDSFVLDEVIREDPGDAPDGVYFRKGPVSIVKNGQTIHQGSFPEASLNDSMERALSFLHDASYDPLIRISAFHYMFGYIHPFYNGNGRMSRFISSAMLAAESIHLLVALRLSYVIKSHRTQYYELFKNTNDHRNFGDMTCFIVGFLKMIHEACEQVLLFLNEKEKLLSHYDAIIRSCTPHEEAGNMLFILTQVSVCGGESLSLPQLADACGLSLYKAKKTISLLLPLCNCTTKGRSVLYRADLEALDRIHDDELL